MTLIVLSTVSHNFIENIEEFKKKYSITNIYVIGKDAKTNRTIITLRTTKEEFENMTRDGHLIFTEKSTPLSSTTQPTPLGLF